VIVACNCDYGCPCNFNGRPSTGKCEGNWNWHIEQGDFGDLSLSGLTFSLAVNWPGAIHEGNGNGILEVHPRAILPEGFVFKEGQLGASAKFRVEGPVSFDHTGRYTALAPFEYQGP
jgi:hypothetical protein